MFTRPEGHFEEGSTPQTAEALKNQLALLQKKKQETKALIERVLKGQEELKASSSGFDDYSDEQIKHDLEALNQLKNLTPQKKPTKKGRQKRMGQTVSSIDRARILDTNRRLMPDYTFDEIVSAIEGHENELEKRSKQGKQKTRATHIDNLRAQERSVEDEIKNIKARIKEIQEAQNPKRSAGEGKTSIPQGSQRISADPNASTIPIGGHDFRKSVIERRNLNAEQIAQITEHEEHILHEITNNIAACQNAEAEISIAKKYYSGAVEQAKSLSKKQSHSQDHEAASRKLEARREEITRLGENLRQKKEDLRKHLEKVKNGLDSLIIIHDPENINSVEALSLEEGIKKMLHHYLTQGSIADHLGVYMQESTPTPTPAPTPTASHVERKDAREGFERVEMAAGFTVDIPRSAQAYEEMKKLKGYVDFYIRRVNALLKVYPNAHIHNESTALQKKRGRSVYFPVPKSNDVTGRYQVARLKRLDIHIPSASELKNIFWKSPAVILDNATSMGRVYKALFEFPLPAEKAEKYAEVRKKMRDSLEFLKEGAAVQDTPSGNGMPTDVPPEAHDEDSFAEDDDQERNSGEAGSEKIDTPEPPVIIHISESLGEKTPEDLFENFKQQVLEVLTQQATNQAQALIAEAQEEAKRIKKKANNEARDTVAIAKAQKEQLLAELEILRSGKAILNHPFVQQAITFIKGDSGQSSEAS